MQGLDPLTTRTCRKGYPRPFQQETIITEDGYSIYRRRDTGLSFTLPVRTSGQNVIAVIDNRRVVPYSPYFSLRYKAHINVEVCGSVKAAKYIDKYIYKGGDRATAILDSEPDEIKRHLHGRYIGSTEAVWQLFEFHTHQKLPSVTPLALSLSGQQAVYCSEQETSENLRAHLYMSTTTLLAFYEYNSEKEEGRQYLSQEFPEHYVYERNKGWKTRKQRFSIGRMWSASHFNGEWYYLRLLLTVVDGAISFEDLRRIDGVQYPTFKSACIALRLLEDDGECIAMFRDGSEFITGRAFRPLFALALKHTTLTNALAIWEEFKESFCDDLAHLIVTGVVVVPAVREDMGASLAHDYGLYDIQQFLNKYGRTLVEFSLPQQALDWRQNVNQAGGNVEIGEKLEYDREQELVMFDSRREKLNEEQVACFDAIVAAVERDEQDPQQQEPSGAFFLHGPAGTGKIFLYNCLCSDFRAQGKIVLCVIPSLIAAQLLPGGGSAHSRIKIPLTTDSNAVCNITQNSFLADLIRRTSLIIWDEVPMQHKACFEAVNRTLNDICHTGNGQLFGVIPTVLGTDFAQILPVIRRGARQLTVLAAIRHSSVWHSLHILRLRRSMCMITNEANYEFLSFLREIVTNPVLYESMLLPPYIRSMSTINQLCDNPYPQALLNEAVTTHGALLARAILALRNETVNDFNNVLLERMPEE